MHVTNARGVRLVERARSQNRIDASCETCPHYLLFSENDMECMGGIAKCAPPLRSEDERGRLLSALREAAIDTVGSDHLPAPPEMKRGDDFFGIWGGISGVQIALPALLTTGIDVNRITSLTAAAVAKRFRLHGKGAIRPGNDADLALVDAAVSSLLDGAELYYRHRLSPYVGMRLRDAVKRVLLRGHTIALEAQGKFILPGESTGRFVRPVLP